MISNGNRDIRICDLSLRVSNGVVVAVIDDNATPNHHILPQANLLCSNQSAIAIPDGGFNRNHKK